MRLQPLIFVRRGVIYCNAVARAIAALLGRFLPRLGPLATRERPFFWLASSAVALFRRRPVGPQLFQRDLAQPPRQRLQVGRQRGRSARERS